MDGERNDGGGGAGGGGGGGPEVVDEFACAGMLRVSLTSLHSTVERIFGVTFSIGAEDVSHGNNGQIWLKLQGQSSSVKAAKVSHDFLVLWCHSPDRDQFVSLHLERLRTSELVVIAGSFNLQCSYIGGGFPWK